MMLLDGRSIFAPRRVKRVPTFDELRVELLAASARGDHEARERILREIQSLTYQVASTP